MFAPHVLLYALLSLVLASLCAEQACVGTLGGSQQLRLGDALLLLWPLVPLFLPSLPLGPLFLTFLLLGRLFLFLLQLLSFLLAIVEGYL